MSDRAEESAGEKQKDTEERKKIERFRHSRIDTKDREIETEIHREKETLRNRDREKWITLRDRDNERYGKRQRDI